ncbi:MAG: hypothetical protein HUU54_07775 [Ignavibacteriaceae bacterium]|nr:hypothetical protein [Ignavibacteriaceae bacterium]
MKTKELFSFRFFPSLQNRDEYFEQLLSEEKPLSKSLNLGFFLLIFAFAYGAAMGSYHSFEQALSAALKVPVLFALSIIICIPALFIIQYILGSRLKPVQMLNIILSGFVLITAIMVSFIPIVILFLLTGGDYYFLQLLHIAIFILSGIFGMKHIIDALRYTCENKGIYPKTGVEVAKFWVVILGLVGIQLAWNLRPFTGDYGKPFALFREYEGNFYSAIIYSFNKLLEDGDTPKKSFNYPQPIKKDSVFLTP